MRLPDAEERIEAFYSGEGGTSMNDTYLLLQDRRVVEIDGVVIIDEIVTPEAKLAHLLRCAQASKDREVT